MYKKPHQTVQYKKNRQIPTIYRPNLETTPPTNQTGRLQEPYI